jgi:tetratricopeptide (TPR) repeat protein
MSIPDEYQKIIQIFTDKQALIRSIRSKIHLVPTQAMAFTLFDGQRQKTTRNLSKESASFLGFQILFSILRKIPRTDQALHEMLEKCSDYYRFNIVELKKIEQFRMTYTMDKAAEWYTSDSFVYRLVNKVLRTEDIELLYIFRFYIVDLCSQLEQEHKKLLPTQVLTLYRGQVMPTEEFEKLRQSVGILISPNGFFSTSRYLSVAFSFIADHHDTDEKKGVMFEITVDPPLESVIFADIDTYSRMQEEKEVLFSLGAMFIITQVDYDSSMNIWKVYMKATDEGSKQASEYLKFIRNQMEEEYSPAILFGYLLWRDIGAVDKAKKYFQTLLESLPHGHEDIPSVYHQIGGIFYEKGEWNMALDFFTKAYDLRCQYLPSDHIQIASSLNNIGAVYEDKQDFDQALDYWNRSLSIYQKNYSGDHSNIARTLMNTGIVFRQKKEYENALDCSTKALEMYKRVLPEQHHSIARCLCNIGYVYELQFNFDRALEFYHQTYKMNEKVLSSDHIYLTKDLNGIVDTYSKNGEYEKAINFCNMKLAEQRLNLPKTHPRIGHTLQTIGDIYSEKDSTQAFSYYQEALTIFESCTPSDQQAIPDCLEHIGDLYYNLGAFDEALKYRKDALHIQEKYRSSQHPITAVSLQCIGRIYYSMKDYLQALDYFKRALRIYEANYVPECEKIKETQHYIDEIDNKLNETIA